MKKIHEVAIEFLNVYKTFFLKNQGSSAKKCLKRALYK